MRSRAIYYLLWLFLYLSEPAYPVALINLPPAAGTIIPAAGMTKPRWIVLAEFDMFSGRPNPSWTLLDTETKTLVEKLKSLPAATDGAVNDRLGYRGIVLMSTDDSDTGFVNVIVSAGLVIVTESDSSQRRLADV
ncbi:MAG TPA: hypothetical protein VM656_07810, partial [Pyrinomonadaceae bacterium]|nr:hypothetical protein [Pyrinomonadaceae bacterium]